MLVRLVMIGKEEVLVYIVVGLDVGTPVFGALVGAFVSSDIGVRVFGVVGPVLGPSGPLVGPDAAVLASGAPVGSLVSAFGSLVGAVHVVVVLVLGRLVGLVSYFAQ